MTLAMLALALSPPRLGIVLRPLEVEGGGTGLRVASVDASGPNAGRVVEGAVVTAFQVPGERIEADARLLVEEPDTLPDYGQYNRFLRDQDALARGLTHGTLEVVLAGGERVALAGRPGRAADLPWLFWFQVFVGAAGVMTGAIVLALGRTSRATRLYALTGLGYVLFAPAAAVYSTRELALDGATFRALSVLNHFGALFFTASLTALLWHYPRSLGRVPVAALCYLAALGVWGLDTWQVMDTPLVFHLGVLGIFLTSVLFAGGQWIRTRHQPADRAALRWFLLSIYLATGLFAGTVIVPAALGTPLPASQGVMFGAFLVMYWGLALGVVRYRLFRLEEWWYAVWGWFLGGVVVVVLDVLLLGLLEVEAGLALAVALAVAGWLYFPLRQWLWDKVGRAPARPMQDWLPAALPLLLRAPETDDPERELLDRWPALLATVFAPLGMEASDAPDATPGSEIEENGLALRVATSLAGTEPLLLRHADGGRRLFTRRDLATLAALRGLFALTLDLLRAREAGADAERARIARDLHDDLGARLLSLLYRSREEDQAAVRDALVCTRELLQTLNLTPVGLSFALSRWRTELRERLEPAGVGLGWVQEGVIGTTALTARQNANLTRILREAVTNALKHAGARHLDVSVVVTDEGLCLTVKDDGRGVGDGSLDQGGRGVAIMRARAEELGGDVSWRSPADAGGGCAVVVRIPRKGRRGTGAAPDAAPAGKASA